MGTRYYVYNSFSTNRFCVEADNQELYYIGGYDELINRRRQRQRERLPTTV